MADRDSTRQDPSAEPVFSPGRLRGTRHTLGVGVGELARRADVGPDEITAYEDGTKVPDRNQVGALAAALGCPVEALYGQPGAERSREYWQAASSAMPPFTTTEIDAVAEVLRSIDRSQRPPEK